MLVIQIRLNLVFKIQVKVYNSFFLRLRWNQQSRTYDGPTAPPVFVVLESDLESHELRSSSNKISKKFSEPIKNIAVHGMQLPKKGGSAIIRGGSKVGVLNFISFAFLI